MSDFRLKIILLPLVTVSEWGLDAASPTMLRCTINGY